MRRLAEWLTFESPSATARHFENDSGCNAFSNIKQHTKMAEESLSSYSLSSSMSTSGSSPIKATHASYAPHIRSEVEKLLSTNIEILRAADFWKPLGYRARDFTRVDTHVKKAGIQTMEPMRDGVFSSCLNILSAHVRAKFRLGECQYAWNALLASSYPQTKVPRSASSTLRTQPPKIIRLAQSADLILSRLGSVEQFTGLGLRLLWRYIPLEGP